MKAFPAKSAIVIYLAGVFIVHAAVFWNVRKLVWKGYSDFTIYYCAGTMARQGLGRQLYDDREQFRVQREFAPDVAIRQGALPYNHPPFEALLFAPFTYFSYPVAFVLWDVLNLAMLTALPFLLRPHLHQLQNYSPLLWVLASLAFFPVFFALLQGQDSILLLLLYALAFACLKKNRDSFAGGWLALGLFKPQLVLPFVVLLLVQGRKKVLYGFFPAAAVLAVVSIAIVGRAGAILYPQYVFHLEGTLARGAIVPADMPNLRGMLDFFFPGSPYLVPAILAASLALFLVTAWECRKSGGNNLFDLKFSLATIATVLVSYHALAYDLSVLMLPVLLMAQELLGKGKFRGYRSVFAAVGILFFPPLQLVVYARYHRAALLGWVLLLWLFGVAKQISFQASEGLALQTAGPAD